MTEIIPRLPAAPHFYPDVRLPDRQWERVIAALFLRNTKADAAVLSSIEDQIQEARRKRLEYDKRREQWGRVES